MNIMKCDAIRRSWTGVAAPLIAAHLAVGSASAEDPLDHWESRYPDPADLDDERGPLLNLGGEAGERYDIEFSPELDPGSWSILSRGVLESDGLQIVPPDPPHAGQGFWRIRW